MSLLSVLSFEPDVRSSSTRPFADETLQAHASPWVERGVAAVSGVAAAPPTWTTNYSSCLHAQRSERARKLRRRLTGRLPGRLARLLAFLMSTTAPGRRRLARCRCWLFLQTLVSLGAKASRRHVAPLLYHVMLPLAGGAARTGQLEHNARRELKYEL